MGEAGRRARRWDEVAQLIRTKTLDADLLRQHMAGTAEPVPESLRGHVWMVLLGLGKRIGKDTYDHISSEVSFEDREPAIKECSKVLLRLPDKELVFESFLKDASLVVTYYARLTGRPSDAIRRLTGLVAPFFALKLPRSDLFACFYSFMERFGLVESAITSGTLNRLVAALVLFHDPALGLHLKSVGVLQALPSLCGRVVLVSQLGSMFVGRGNIATSVALMQALIVESDSILPLFVLVASLMEQRQAILEIKEYAAMEEALTKLPTPAQAGPPNLLLLRALHLRSRTPEAALSVYLQAGVLVTAPVHAHGRRQPGTAGGARGPPSAEPSPPLPSQPSATLPLPLPTTALADVGLVLQVDELFSPAPVGDWHIVDLRTVADADSGTGVPLRSTVLDPALIVGDPERLQAIEAELASHYGEYIAVLPHGPRPPSGAAAAAAPADADSAANVADVVAAMFYLQASGFAHVAVIDGDGFVGFHRHALKAHSPLLADHQPRKCPLCRAATAAVPLPTVSSLVSDTAAVAAAAAGRVTSTLGLFWTATKPAEPASAAKLGAEPTKPAAVDSASAKAGPELASAAAATEPPPKVAEKADKAAEPEPKAPLETMATVAAPWVARFKETSSVLGQRLKTATESITAAALADCQRSATRAAVEPLEDELVGEASSSSSSATSLAPDREEDEELDKRSLPADHAGRFSQRNTTEWLLDPTVHMFPCREYLAHRSRHYPRTVVVTQTELVLCRDHPQRPQVVYALATYPLVDVRRVSSKKKHTNIITLVVRVAAPPSGDGDGDGDSAAPTTPAAPRLVAHTLIFKDAADFVDLLKSRLRLLPPLPAAANADASSPADSAAPPQPSDDTTQPVGSTE